ncbi:unnamed protein product, partial [Gadus morhua 'NCC']
GILDRRSRYRLIRCWTRCWRHQLISWLSCWRRLGLVNRLRMMAQLVRRQLIHWLCRD